jgi:hypothetical protein
MVVKLRVAKNAGRNLACRLERGKPGIKKEIYYL